MRQIPKISPVRNILPAYIRKYIHQLHLNRILDPVGVHGVLKRPYFSGILARTGTQIKLLASEMIPKELCQYFGSHMCSYHGRSHFSPIAKWGSNNFFSKCQFHQEK